MITNTILKLYGIEEGELVPINDGFHNTVYSYGNLIFRVTPLKRRSQYEIMNELQYIKGLWENGISVSTSIKSLRGRLVEEINDSYLVVAFHKAKGKPIDVTDRDVWNKELFYHWGNLMGKIHQAGKNIKINRPSWTAMNPDLLNLFPKITSKTITDKYQQLLSKIASFQPTTDVFGMIHNDFHQGNIYVNDGKITVFDFDDCAYYWYAYDLAVSFYHAYWQSTSFTPDYKDFCEDYWENFIRGYMVDHKVNKVLIMQIPVFLKIREIYLYTLFLEKWKMGNLAEWQEYTLNDLKIKIENDIPYTDFDFSALL